MFNYEIYAIKAIINPTAIWFFLNTMVEMLLEIFYYIRNIEKYTKFEYFGVTSHEVSI